MRPPSIATRIFLVGLCALMFGLAQFHRASGGVLSPILQDGFVLTSSELGFTISLMYLGVVLMQLPVGAALDRLGVTMVLPVSLCVVGAATLVFSEAWSRESLMASRLGVGFGVAALTSSTHIIISRIVSNARFGLANGLVVSFGGVGGVIGAFPLAAVVADHGWRAVFHVIGLGTFALALVVFIALLATGRFSPPPRSSSETTASASDAPSFLKLLVRADFLRVLAMSFVAFAPITTITGLWGGPFYESVFGFEPERAGAILSAMYATMILAAFTFGGLDAWVRSRRRLIFSAAAISTTLMIAAAVVPYGSIWPVTACLFVMIFSQQFYIPLLAHMQRIMPAASLGRASAVFSLVGVFGISVMQFLFGVVIDIAHAAGVSTPGAYRIAFGMMAAIIAGMAAIYATGREDSK